MRSRGKILNRLFELGEEICQFMDSKGKDSTVLRDEKWKCELAFLADITPHLSVPSAPGSRAHDH